MRPVRAGIVIFVACTAALAVLVVWSVGLPGAASGSEPRLGHASQADVEWGGRLLSEYGCGSCHVIPGVAGANGRVGPPLSGFASRAYIAGNLPNTMENLVRWIQHPQDVEPGTIMPDLGVSEHNARRMASYLSTLD